jgi:uncharacterized membrane protein
MARTRPQTDVFRTYISLLASVIVTVPAVMVIPLVTDVDLSDPARLVMTIYVISWPLYTAFYLGWSAIVYSRLNAATLRQATVLDDRRERRPISRIIGLSGATATTISAATLAVIATVTISQQSALRSEPVYIGLALVTVASSWAQMVFAFTQSYLRLGASDDRETHFTFHIPGTARFDDYVTLALLVSTMAATVPADITSRRAWRVVRTNVVIAFVFNSVIIAMMVSFLFGGLLG